MNLKYLIIEDSIKVCEGIAERMQQYPEWQACNFACHVDDAIKSIATNHPQLIFLDWSLKGGSAIEVLSQIEAMKDYSPYIIFNTGYQSENPQIPQEIFNNFTIDKYIIKPVWENFRQHLSEYLAEAAAKTNTEKTGNKILLTDINREKIFLNSCDLIFICIHPETPYIKSFYLANGKRIFVKKTWNEIYGLLKEHHISHFITNHKQHIVTRHYIEAYHRPYVKLKHLNNKVEVVKDKLSAFEKWMKNKP